MSDFSTDPKSPFIDLFEKQKKKLENLLEEFRRIEQKTTPDSEWRLLRESPFNEWIYPLARKSEKIMPTTIVEVAIQTLDEYISALERFSPEQLEAFFFGLGLKWIPFQFWGLEHLRKHYKDLPRAIDYFKNVESSVPEESQWQHMDYDPIKVLDDVRTDHLLYSEIILRDHGLVKSILDVLAKENV
jgi:hypothetical protein